MRSAMLALVLLGVVMAATDAGEPNQLPPKDQIAPYLQEISVTIKAEGGYRTKEGSGALFTRVMPDGSRRTFIWTAAHVVDVLRKEEEIVDPRTGTKRQRITFKDCHLVREEIEDGRRVGESKMDAQPYQFSKHNDLAILLVRKRNFSDNGAVFWLSDEIPSVGADLYHCGSPGGQQYGANSLTDGIVASIGRLIDGQEYDQTTCMAVGGSSGGLLVKKDTGEYVGMLTRGIRGTDNFNFMIPVRRIREWAKERGVEWLVDQRVPVPKDWDKLPVEDPGVSFEGSGTDKKLLEQYPYLIRYTRPGPTPALRPIPDPLGILEP